MKKLHLSTFIYSFLFTFIILCMIVYPSDSYQAALDGLNLWFNSVCPALLPFFICIDILIGLGFVSFIGELFKPVMRPLFKLPGESSFALIMSFSSGYPVGARITAKLRKDKICTKAEGQRMLSLCSSSGPLFIIGAVATGILNNPSLGILLALSHYLSAISVGIFARFMGIEKNIKKVNISINPMKELINQRKNDGRTVGAIIGDSVKNGVSLILNIGGFIVLFSVITSAFKTSGLLQALSDFICLMISNKTLTPEIVSSFIVGLLEVTNGVKACSLIDASLAVKTCLISFMIGFGGLSINAQVLSIISETDLKFNVYFLIKISQGFIASIYSYFGYRLFFNTDNIIRTIYTFYSSKILKYNELSYRQTLYLSFHNLGISLIILLFLSSIVYLVFYNKTDKKKIKEHNL